MSGVHIPTRLVGVLSLVGLTAVTLIVFSGAFRIPFEPDTREVMVDFDRAGQLYPGDQVRLEGNIEGKVAEIAAAPGGSGVRATLEVETDAGDIYQDATARLRMKTLLGGAFYVEIDRGTAQAGPLGDRVIGRDRTAVQVEVEDVTDVFRQRPAEGLKKLPGESAQALADPEHPAAAVRAAGDVAPDATRALKALRGRNPGDDLPDLIEATSATVAALDTPSDDLRALVGGAATTLSVTARRRAEIRQTINDGPGVTSDLTVTLARLDGTLANVRTLVRRLEPGAPAIAPTLKALRPTLPETTRLLRNARPLVRVLETTLISLDEFARHGVPLLDRIKPSLVRTGDKILPYLGRKDPDTGRSTTVMIGGTAAGFGGAAMQQDGNGHFIRFPASLGTSSVYLPCRTNITDASAPSVLACDSLQTALGEYLSYLPLSRRMRGRR